MLTRLLLALELVPVSIDADSYKTAMESLLEIAQNAVKVRELEQADYNTFWTAMVSKTYKYLHAQEGE